MKKSALTALLLLSVSALSAQGTIQQVIATAGGSQTAPGGSYYTGWTVGETLVATWKAADGSMTLSGGIQQNIIITAVETTPGWDIEVNIYPNPVGSILTIKFNVPLKETFLLYLYDVNGRLVTTERTEEMSDIIQINMEEFPSGTYFLRVADEIRSNTYKVVKL
jgi:hypothetical protein